LDRILTENLGSTPHRGSAAAFLLYLRQPEPGEEVIHEHGPLWPAVRASLALPGIFPPVYGAGDLLIDGSAVNNVPVDVMRDRWEMAASSRSTSPPRWNR